MMSPIFVSLMIFTIRCINFASGQSSNFNCTVSNLCQSGTYNCSANTDCYIHCIGFHVCQLATFNCPENYNCYITAGGPGNEAMVSTTVNGGDHGNIIFESGGSQYTAYKTVIYCPLDGFCNLTATTGGQSVYWDAKIHAENAKQLNIYTTANWGAANANIYCPLSSTLQPNCNVYVESGDAMLDIADFFVPLSFVGISITCNYLSNPISACYKTNDQPTMHCGSAPTYSSSCRMQVINGYDAWGCIDNSSICHDITYSPTTSPTITTSSPTPAPTNNPTPAPTSDPTRSPSKNPTSNPTTGPSPSPTNQPTPAPTSNPTPAPTSNPTISPTNNPTVPTFYPTHVPTFTTNNPTQSPTGNPSKNPTIAPTNNPTQSPTGNPSKNPTIAPTNNPTRSPSKNPTFTTNNPTSLPTQSPTGNPSKTPTIQATIDSDTAKTQDDSSTVITALIVVFSVLILVVAVAIFWVVQKKKKRKPVQTWISIPLMTETTGNGEQKNIRANEDQVMQLNSWLDCIGLSEYCDTFVSNGFDSVDMLKEINDKNDLIDIGITLKGHQLKLMNRIQKLKDS